MGLLELLTQTQDHIPSVERELKMLDNWAMELWILQILFCEIFRQYLRNPVSKKIQKFYEVQNRVIVHIS